MNLFYSSRPASSQPSSQSPSISASFLGLIHALAEHLLALFSLASLEACQLFKRTVVALVLLIAIIVTLFISYIALLITLALLVVFHFHLDWVVVLGAVAFLHALLGAAFILVIRRQYISPAFQMTAAEVRRDIESLASYTPPLS